MDHPLHLLTYLDHLGAILGPRMESESLLSHPFQTREFGLRGLKLNKNERFRSEKKGKNVFIQACSEKLNPPPRSTQCSALC